MFRSTLGRMIVVPIAFTIAAVATIAVLLTLGLERATDAFYGRNEDSVLVILDLVRQTFRLVSALSILPALALVIVGEVARIRSSAYYIVGGGAALAAVPLLASAVESHGLVLPAAAVWQVFATAGFCGGFVYWLLAGRRA
ncbi:MAG: hypothetical protein ACREC6_06915 [Hyphomicrobiaceae bacterium]